MSYRHKILISWFCLLSVSFAPVVWGMGEEDVGGGTAEPAEPGDTGGTKLTNEELSSLRTKVLQDAETKENQRVQGNRSLGRISVLRNTRGLTTESVSLSELASGKADQSAVDKAKQNALRRLAESQGITVDELNAKTLNPDEFDFISEESNVAKPKASWRTLLTSEELTAYEAMDPAAKSAFKAKFKDEYEQKNQEAKQAKIKKDQSELVQQQWKLVKNVTPESLENQTLEQVESLATKLLGSDRVVISEMIEKEEFEDRKGDYTTNGKFDEQAYKNAILERTKNFLADRILSLKTKLVAEDVIQKIIANEKAEAEKQVALARSQWQLVKNVTDNSLQTQTLEQLESLATTLLGSDAVAKIKDGATYGVEEAEYETNGTLNEQAYKNAILKSNKDAFVKTILKLKTELQKNSGIKEIVAAETEAKEKTNAQFITAINSPAATITSAQVQAVDFSLLSKPDLNLVISKLSPDQLKQLTITQIDQINFKKITDDTIAHLKPQQLEALDFEKMASLQAKQIVLHLTEVQMQKLSPKVLQDMIKAIPNGEQLLKGIAAPIEEEDEKGNPDPDQLKAGIIKAINSLQEANSSQSSAS